MVKFKILLLVILAAACLCQCNTSTEGSGTETDNPVPALTSISPTSKVSHMPSFTLTATGTNFVTGSAIVFGGIQKATTYVSSTELTCQIDPDDIDSSSSSTNGYDRVRGILSTDVSVLVRNPSPGGGDSGSVNFTIENNHTFSNPQNISNTSADSRSPAIAVDGTGNINVVWDDAGPDSEDIFFCLSEDNGSSFSSPVNLSDNSGNSFRPDIAVDSAGNINVVWTQQSIYQPGIRFRRSTNSGTSFNPAVAPPDATLGSDPALAVDASGNINLVWSDIGLGQQDIFFCQSTSNGSSFSPAVNVSSGSRPEDSPAIAVDSAGNINLVWDDWGFYGASVYFSRSADGGNSFSPVEVLSNDGSGDRPAIAVDSAGNICVVMREEVNGIVGLCFTRSTDGGSSFDPLVLISDRNGSAPSIAVDSVGNINIIWKQLASGQFDIFFCRSADNGNSFCSPINISNSPGTSNYPEIAVDGAGNISVVWEDWTPGNGEIAYSGSTR